MWHSTKLGTRGIICTGGMCCGIAVGLNGLNLGSGNFSHDVIPRQDSVIRRVIQLRNEGNDSGSISGGSEVVILTTLVNGILSWISVYF